MKIIMMKTMYDNYFITPFIMILTIYFIVQLKINNILYYNIINL